VIREAAVRGCAGLIDMLVAGMVVAAENFLCGLFQTEPWRTDEDALPIAASWSERSMIRSY
jgi:hypothetical protein